jgi:hypothetical protein
MKTIFLSSILGLFLIWSCSNESTKEEPVEKSTEVEETEVEEVNNWIGLAILDGGFRLGIDVPSENVSNGKSEIIYHEDIGELEIIDGEHFDILLLEDESQIEMVKNDLNNHAFYNVEFIVVNDSSLLYRQYTEDNNKKDQWHMYCERKLGPSMLLVRSKGDISFSEYQAKLMLQSALSIKPF